ncbi:class I SAM-dependent methyltransferase [Bacillus benzoevorans]|uniref:Ubiquinone/menaquinone biosynthesis C-methylase UbiE n=1 Tax=Bacillus benzoevorans TaxID=1456 RepID=A0A7X0HNY6_9BACI|nr:class I SAM-dependent methyltransferase [Bacillus benzoevorans]MBB6444292.1 ubiquinone/menaquinone biosynthesis C-methylase UbiE [Bacillus benzoevorans]
MSENFAKWYDPLMNPLEQTVFKKIRQDLIQRANGRVMELGSGTGINFPLYKDVENVTAIEPNPYMIQRSLNKKEKASVPITVLQQSAEELPFSDHSFDTVIATLVFCTIPNVEQALQEVHRVCKPGGKILLFEHVLMENPVLGKIQTRLTPYWSKICDGCCLDRDTVSVVRQQGFEMVELKQYYRGLFIMMEFQNH